MVGRWVGRRRGMHEHHCPSTFQFGKDGLKAGIAEANPVRIGEQHHAVQLERVEGVSQLIQSAINVWQRQGGKTAQPVRMRLHQLRRELVASARERPRARIVPDVDARVESR